jgi:valyl-tRNA synthetase
MYAPFIPHITETLYQQLYKATEQQSSLHITTFDRDRYTYNYHESAALIQAVLNIVSGVRKLKSEKQLSLKTELHNLIIHVSDAGLLQQLKTQQALIGGITKAIALEFVAQTLEQNVLEEVNGTFVARVRI